MGDVMKKRVVRLLLMVVLLLIGGYMFWELSASDVHAGETVFLVHGLGRSSRSMGLMRRRLRHEGYRVVAVGYNSRKLTIDESAEKLAEAVSNELQRADAPEKIHFVTHSLGGILVRKVLADEQPPELGRVVMLSPPNKGSELPDKLGKIWLYRMVTGPAGLQLGTEKNSYPNQLGPVDFDLGVITGNRSFNPLYSLLIDGKDDGKVSVESAKVEGMNDFLTVHSTHTWIMNRRFVYRYVSKFLAEGRFSDKPGADLAAR
jgi:triacylglycerol esterase/lipase EstA (alpha/beta hydrolase family)